MERHLSEWIFKMEKWDRTINRKIIFLSWVQKCTHGKCIHGKLKCTYAGARVVFDPIKNYVLTTIHGQDLPHFARLCHLARFSVK